MSEYFYTFVAALTLNIDVIFRLNYLAPREDVREKRATQGRSHHNEYG